jgi:ribose transport system substrate-binding protein
MKRALLIAVALVLAGCSPSVTAKPTAVATPVPPVVTIAYSGISTSDDFSIRVREDAAIEAASKGARFLDVTAATADSAAQLAAVNGALATLKKPAALIIAPVDGKVFGDTIAAAKAAGIPILAVGTEIDDPYVSELVDTDDAAAGTLVGQAICKFTGGKGTALVMGGAVGDPVGDARQAAVVAAVTACKMTSFPQHGEMDAAKDVAIASFALTNKADLDAIFVPHGDGAAAVAKFIGGTGRSRYIAVYGFDANPAEIAAMLGGMETGSIRQDNVLIARTVVDSALTVISGGAVPKTVLVPALLVDQSTASIFR